MPCSSCGAPTVHDGEGCSSTGCSTTTTVTASGCGSSGSHRSRTPIRLLTNEDSDSMILNVKEAKNWRIDMLHVSASITFANMIDGRRGHVVVENRKEGSAAALSCGNTDVVTNVNWPLVISDGQTVVIRYYGDVDALILEVMHGV